MKGDLGHRVAGVPGGWQLRDGREILNASPASAADWDMGDAGRVLHKKIAGLLLKTIGRLEAIHDLPRAAAAIAHLAYGHMRRAKVVQRTLG